MPIIDHTYDPMDPHGPCREHIQSLQDQLLNQQCPNVEVWFDDDKGTRVALGVRHVYMIPGTVVVVVDKP